ncbi:MAG: hypothetical protein N3D15_01140 [Syntrophorhabdaceae bacterium]|nr:hypothetical protein [Syntrophorhabdaceae bacterium]
MRSLSVFFLCILILFSFISCNKTTDIPAKTTQEETTKTDTQYKKEMEEIKKNLRGDIKIKLKKDSKGGYSWEITGKDASEVLKANDTLRKKLND